MSYLINANTVQYVTVIKAIYGEFGGVLCVHYCIVLYHTYTSPFRRRLNIQAPSLYNSQFDSSVMISFEKVNQFSSFQHHPGVHICPISSDI